jgi:hypothetical protein
MLSETSLQTIGIQKLREGDHCNTFFSKRFSLLLCCSTTNGPFIGFALMDSTGFVSETIANVLSLAHELAHLVHDGSLKLHELGGLIRYSELIR